MSKEATGENGAILGSGEYWSRVNRSTFFGGLMRRSSETNYHETLREIGNRAGDVVEEIYDDLQEHKKQLRFIDSGRRNQLAKQVRGLYDVCRMAGASCGHSGECVALLSLSGLFGNPFGDDRAVQNAIRKIKNNSDFFASECVELIQKATDWNISFAAGSSEKKRAFLEDVSQGRGKNFLQEVLETYQNSSGTADTRGKCGYPIGSSEYLTHMERVVFRQDVPTMRSARWGSPDYDGLLKDALDAIAHQLERDLERNERENNYITDDTAKELKSAVSELERCGISTGWAGSKIEKLAWFVGGDPAKIRQLQQKLNQLGIGEHLTEDGVYGKKTATNSSRFLNHFLEGVVPSLNWVNPLQSEFTGISIGSSKGQWNNVLQGENGFQYFRVDPPHATKSGGWKSGYFRGERRPIDYNHVNVNFSNPMSELETKLKADYNHYPLSDQAYELLNNMDHSAQMVKIAGKAFLITGIVSDIMELMPTIEADLHDADKKLGSATDHAVAKMEGRWAGSILGGSIGAKYGALIGTAIFPGPGTAIGGFAGGLILGVAGSYGGDWFAQKVIDITEVIQ